MKFRNLFLIALCLLGFLGKAQASERLFTYTYEPETMVRGDWEFENWVTWREGKNKAVGKDNFHKWEFKQEIEYGVTDNYTISLYLNESHESFRNVETSTKNSDSEFDGVSIENKWMIINPVGNPVGLSFYIEPRFASHETELEEKIILGQRSGDWKWALNITHATEWKEEDGESETEGELEFTAGIAKELNKHWALGVEFKNHNEWPEYETWEHTAFFLGPVINYKNENWWATLTVLGQVYGRNYNENLDNQSNLVLDEHEYLNTRLIVGFSF